MILEEDNADDDNIYNLNEKDVKDTGMIIIKAVVPMELDIKKGFKPNHTYDAYLYHHQVQQVQVVLFQYLHLKMLLL
jgi:hypothetical protein